MYCISLYLNIICTIFV